MFAGDSSPFDSSPFGSNSPRLYWQSKDPSSPTRFNNENRISMGNRDTSPSPAKRSSIENLKRASRVKNSNMFAREHNQEYDPASSPMIERPLATGRPLGVQVQGNAYGGKALEGFRQANTISSPLKSPIKTNGTPTTASSPAKGLNSPTKSSLSSKSRYSHQAFDPENGIWSDEEESIHERQLPPGKGLHRHAKSVTFDVAPPQVNEYEMTTPDPSSVASGSRDGSYDSAGDEEEDDSFDRGDSMERDDSFDASLEDTAKTPVVLPEDWRFMSPEVANENLTADVEDPFNGEHSSPVPTARPSPVKHGRVSPTRTDSMNSDSDRRPLPPLPALGMPAFPRARSDSHDSLSATAERVSNTHRGGQSPPRPAPASISKSEIQGMGGCSMAIEDRLRLMMLQEGEKPQSAVTEQQEQRERRLRRGSPVRSPDSGDKKNDMQVQEQEAENDDVADLGEYKLPPRISRESILRKVKSRTFNEPEDEFSLLGLSPSSLTGSTANLDPDIPLPSVETAMATEVTIKQEAVDEESDVDVYSIPDLYQQQLQAESYMNAIEKLEKFKEAKAASNDDDDESHYSVDSKEDGGHAAPSSTGTADEGPPTPRAETRNQLDQSVKRKDNRRMSLPQFAALLGDSDFGFGMESFMTPSPPINQEPEKPAQSVKSSRVPSPPPMSDFYQFREKLSREQFVERPITPEVQFDPPRIPGQWNDSINEPSTPESVIRHPIDEPVPGSPAIPEPAATIRAPGGKLKTRASITPADAQAMAEIRRQVSDGSEVPAVPKIPDQHLNRPSMIGEEASASHEIAIETDSIVSSEEKDASRRGQRKSSLLPLEVPVEETEGLGIESEFDRVIEAQKVAFNFLIPQIAADAWSPGHAEYIAGQEFKPVYEYCANKAFRTQKGYLMRQNTKVIIASSASHESAEPSTEPKESSIDSSVRGTRSAGNSPRKASNMTMEPWNGKVRRKSLRKSGGVPSKAPSYGPVPPLPGQQSNVSSGLDVVSEDASMEFGEEIGEDGERGRLFVKVVRVKDLDLPLPKGGPLIRCYTPYPIC